MNTEVERFADYLIEWIVSKSDVQFGRLTEFNIIRVIVDYPRFKSSINVNGLQM